MRFISMVTILSINFLVNSTGFTKMASPEMIAKINCAKNKDLKNNDLQKCIEVEVKKIRLEQKEFREKMRKRGIRI